MKIISYTSFILLIILISGFSSCQKVEIKTEVPPCIEEQIQSYEKSKLPCESGKSVYRYIFNDRYVYIFNPGDCGADMMSDIYDENCVRLCGLGGIAGNLLCEEINFWEEASDETLIWED